MEKEELENPTMFPVEGISIGMTLRDYFAAKSMQAIMAKCEPGRGMDIIAKWAYEYADTMLKARKIKN